MTGVQEQVKVEMAIPMGGEEQMDTSHYRVMKDGDIDEEPDGVVDQEPSGVVIEETGGVEETVVNSYVSIKLKGAGRPIHIRMDEPQLAKTRVISSVEADVYRPEKNKPQLDARIGEIAEKKPGFSQKYRVGQEVLIDSNKKKCHEVPVDREESIPDPRSSFTAQAEVVSIQKIIPIRVSHLNSDSRSSPGKMTRKKKTGSRKNKHGKQLAPYPEPLKQLLSSMQSGERHYVEHNGIKHLVQINLIPVQEDTELEASEESIVVHKPRIVDENAGGSVDRPPDSCSGYEHMDMTGSTSITHQHYEYDRYGEGIDYSNRALDLSDKPLDLTVRRKYSDDTMYQGQPYSVENLNSVVNSSPTYDEENTDILPPYNESSMSTEVRGEVGEEHEYRDASSNYEDDGRVSVQSEDQLFGDGDLNSHVNSKLDVATCDADRGDSNLPSLGRLTLNSENLEGHTFVDNEAKYAVATHYVDQPSAGTFEGPEGILNMLKSGLVTTEQLIQLYCKNQSKKAAALNNYASAKVLDPKVVAEVPHRGKANGNLQTSEQSDVANIPAPAMPNFVTLEVANNSGELLVNEGEKVKLGLRDKLKKKTTSSSSSVY